MVQWLGLGVLTAGAWIQSLVRGLRYPEAMWHRQNKETKKNIIIINTDIALSLSYQAFSKYFTYIISFNL